MEVAFPKHGSKYTLPTNLVISSQILSAGITQFVRTKFAPRRGGSFVLSTHKHVWKIKLATKLWGQVETF